MFNIMLRKIGTGRRVLKEDGFKGLSEIFRYKYNEYKLLIPTAKVRWKKGIESELIYWDRYFRAKGLKFPETYGRRLDPKSPLQPRPASLLPDQSEIHILDVGAGPLTYLGKTLKGKRISITAIDPLAHEYDKIMEKYGIEPLVRSEKLAAEKLTERFAANTFDLVFSRNCIDHSYNPVLATKQMVAVVKIGCYVLMEHHPNEGKKLGYEGLHQYNFSMSDTGDFLIGSRRSQVNVTRKLKNLCETTCELITEEDQWLITKLRKI